MKPGHSQFIDLVRAGPSGLFSRGDMARLDEHVEDGIVGAELIRSLDAASVVDVGSGGGVPGVQLAIELDATVHLVESQQWKAEFLLSCARALDLESSLRVHALRAEEAVEAIGRESVDVGTARALAAPLIVAEYLAPLIRVGGHRLVLWSTQAQATDPAVAPNEILGVGEPTIEPAPTSLRADGVRIVWPKVAACAERIPRRAGVAARRPLR